MMYRNIADVNTNCDCDPMSDLFLIVSPLFFPQDDDMPVITYRLVPAGAENATCPLDSLATTSQYRTLGIRLTKEMLCKSLI